VEEELKRDLVFVIIRLLNLVATIVPLMAHQIWNLKHVMKTLVQLTEGGVTGVTGMTVQCPVEEEIKVELECVTTLHHNLEAKIARLMDHQIRKHKDAMKIHVQSMEGSAIGMSGVHVLRNVVEETKRDQENVTILSLNLVD